MRPGRLTSGQARALEELWPRFGIDDETSPVDGESLFGRKAPLVIEIGFGNGEATWRMARDEPDKDFIGIEVHPPGIGHLLLALEENRLDNVRVFRGDGVEFLQNRLHPESLDEVRIYFPDPWPKKRHHKRRIIQAPFLDLLASRLSPGGLLHLATDWQPYAEHILEVCDAHPAFENMSPTGEYCEKPGWRPKTKYELRGERLGQPSRDILFARKS